MVDIENDDKINDYAEDKERLSSEELDTNMQRNNNKIDEDLNPGSISKNRKIKQMDDNVFYSQKRHYFIMSEEGTPIYSRYGDEKMSENISSFFASILEKYSLFNPDKTFVEKLNYISNDKITIVFFKKGKLYFIGLSKEKDTVSFIYSQLELLYSQILSIMTIERLPQLESDPTSLISTVQDSEQLLDQLIEYSSNSLVSVIKSYQVLPFEGREKINEICQNYLCDSYLCILISPNASSIIAIGKNNLIDISYNDIILIQNLILQSGSLRNTQSWVPICLPGISPDGFMQLYCNFTTSEHFGIIYVTESQDNNLFLKFCDASEKIAYEIKDKNLLNNIVNSYKLNNYDELKDENNLERKESEDDDNVQSTLNDFFDLVFDRTSKENEYSQFLTDMNNKAKFTSSLIEEYQNKEFNDVKYDLNKILINDNQSSNKNLFLSIKYAIFKHKIYNQYFSVNFGNYDKITKNEKIVYNEYNKLYDMYNSLDDKTVNLNDFFHFEKDNKYLHVIYVYFDYIFMVSFNMYKNVEEAFTTCQEIFKLVKSYENNFFICISE